MNERVEEIRRQHAEHVAEYPRPHFCEDYGCQTVGVLLTALAQAERERDAHKAEARVHWLALVEARATVGAYRSLGDPQWIRDELDALARVRAALAEIAEDSDGVAAEAVVGVAERRTWRAIAKKARAALEGR